MSPEEFVGAVEEAVAGGDASRLEAAVNVFASFCFKEELTDLDTFPEGALTALLQITRRPEFLRLKGSYHLLMLFEFDWGRLLDGQKARLLDALTETYDKYSDWMSCFVISELLGEYFCNEASFRALTRLQKTPNVTARALIPHGYEHIARQAPAAELRREALTRLTAMKNDPSPEVRHEVEVALAKVR